MKKLISIINVIPLLASLTFLFPQYAMSEEQTLSKEEIKRVSESQDSFKTLLKVSELPAGLIKQVGEMADPGKPFNSGCVRTPGLASQAMKFACASNDRLWFSYQSGGFCLVNKLELYELQGNKSKLLWSTITPRPMASLSEISEFLKKTVSKAK
ncbi:MAG: hypothetical protein KIT34_11855 [Cyanobacteria bacterium TGS_CYA1]|nr:hypothetical protein [Cyanobacteria bacterium TGS_CYA1]